MRITTRAVLAVAAFATTATPATAQVCLGVPTTDGHYAIAGHVGFPTGAKSYGGNAVADLNGPLSLGGYYGLVDFDDLETNANSFGVRAAYALPNASFSVCPTAALEYTSLSEEEAGTTFELTQTVIPVGVALGKSFAMSPSFSVGLNVIPQYLYIRNELSGSEGGVSGSVTDSSSEFGADGGIYFATRAFYAGASVRFTTVEDTDPELGLNFGLLIGR